MLKDADAQAERLDASAAARAEGAWGRIVPVVFVALGGLTLAIVAVVVIRRSL